MFRHNVVLKKPHVVRLMMFAVSGTRRLPNWFIDQLEHCAIHYCQCLYVDDVFELSEVVRQSPQFSPKFQEDLAAKAIEIVVDRGGTNELLGLLENFPAFED